jgi:hypothetical protein
VKSWQERSDETRDPYGERRPVVARELAVQLGERIAHLGGGAHRPQGVILVQHGNAEHRHHRVADELLDRPLVALDDPPHAREVARHDVPQRLRVEPLPERRRAGDVAEDDGDALPHLVGGRRGGERRAAAPAEPESRGALATADGADPHER